MVGDHAYHHSGHLLRKTPEARLLYPRKLPRRPFAIQAVKGHMRTHALQQRTSLFNHFLGAAEQREWESDWTIDTTQPDPEPASDRDVSTTVKIGCVRWRIPAQSQRV